MKVPEMSTDELKKVVGETRDQIERDYSALERSESPKEEARSKLRIFREKLSQKESLGEVMELLFERLEGEATKYIDTSLSELVTIEENLVRRLEVCDSSEVSYLILEPMELAAPLIILEKAIRDKEVELKKAVRIQKAELRSRIIYEPPLIDLTPCGEDGGFVSQEGLRYIVAFRDSHVKLFAYDYGAHMYMLEYAAKQFGDEFAKAAMEARDKEAVEWYGSLPIIGGGFVKDLQDRGISLYGRSGGAGFAPEEIVRGCLDISGLEYLFSPERRSDEQKGATPKKWLEDRGFEI